MIVRRGGRARRDGGARGAKHGVGEAGRIAVRVAAGQAEGEGGRIAAAHRQRADEGVDLDAEAFAALQAGVADGGSRVGAVAVHADDAGQRDGDGVALKAGAVDEPRRDRGAVAEGLDADDVDDLREGVVAHLREVEEPAEADDGATGLIERVDLHLGDVAVVVAARQLGRTVVEVGAREAEGGEDGRSGGLAVLAEATGVVVGEAGGAGAVAGGARVAGLRDSDGGRGGLVAAAVGDREDDRHGGPTFERIGSGLTEGGAGERVVLAEGLVATEAPGHRKVGQAAIGIEAADGTEGGNAKFGDGGLEAGQDGGRGGGTGRAAILLRETGEARRAAVRNARGVAELPCGAVGEAGERRGKLVGDEAALVDRDEADLGRGREVVHAREREGDIVVGLAEERGREVALDLAEAA